MSTGLRLRWNRLRPLHPPKAHIWRVIVKVEAVGTLRSGSGSPRLRRRTHEVIALGFDED